MIIHDEEQERREYHRTKAAEQRANWKAMNCVVASNYVPERYKLYMRGISSCLNASHCLSLIREGNAVAIDIMADTRPRYDVKLEDVDVLQGRHAWLDKRCELMVKYLREARWHRAEGQQNRASAPVASFHYAVEWCIITYLKGYYDITLHMMQHGDEGLRYDFDVFDMREDVPSVL